jgi:antitoxin (DNA-binding transcriptional repressor) of toxin-antitoxin stability system
MKIINFTDFHNNSKEYLDKVENGILYYNRKGKPVAKIIPFNK